MVLFGGVLFAIVAATVRTVMILTAAAEGGHAASEWGCREIFVSIVVANLPIIQPLMRKLASKLGLDMLFSSSDTRPAQSNQGDQGTDKAAGSKDYFVAHPARPPKDPGVLADRERFSTLPSCSTSQRGSNRPAWASEERILMSDLSDVGNVGCASWGTTGEMTIKVGTEVRVMSERVDLESQSMRKSSVHSKSDEGGRHKKRDK